jgi:Mn-dependent DtxR family transcriptional regulator
VIPRWWRHRSRAVRTARENTLKAIYHVLEARNFDWDVISIEALAQWRRETLEEAQAQARNLQSVGLVTLTSDGTVALTPNGWRRACTIVRNHRLWELYLTNAANYDADHVHEDAEKIEHMLGEEIVRHLERRLEFPHKDPHGKPIPGIRDMQHHDTSTGGRTTGYG